MTVWTSEIIKAGIENVPVTDVAAGALVLVALERVFESGENRVCPLEDPVSSARTQHPMKSFALRHFTGLFSILIIQDELQDTK